jgi:hypothetical protein
MFPAALSTILPAARSPARFKFSSEIQFLLCCTRTQMNEAMAATIRARSQQPLDWSVLLKLAAHHKLLPLLYKNLCEICSNNVPESVLSELREQCQINTTSNLFITAELLRLLEQFKYHHLPAIPYKGSTLAVAVYGNLALRQFDDIDLWVAPSNFTKARMLLAEQGYQLTEQLGWESTFVHSQTSIPVDLHQGIAQPYFPFRPVFAEFWQRCYTVSVLGKFVLSLAPEDLLLILSVQLAKDCHHLQILLIKVCDVAELITHYPDLNWQHLVQRSQQLGCQRLLWLSLRLVEELLGVTVPDFVRQQIQSDWIVSLYSQSICKQLFVTPQRSRSTTDLLLRGLMLLEYPLTRTHNRSLLRQTLIYGQQSL